MRDIVLLRFKGYSSVVAESSLKVNFLPRKETLSRFSLCHAERLADTASCIPGNPSDSLRRDGAVATILQQTPTPLVDSEVCQGLPTQRRLPSFRSDSGHF